MLQVTDGEIIDLYFARSEDAISETNIKYGKLCFQIIFGILCDKRDSEECINDTWMALWNAIPPKKPNPFKAYVCRVAKNLALKKWEYNHAGKRNSELEMSLEELSDCVNTAVDVEREVEQKLMEDVMNRFLAGLPAEKRILFLRRYWFLHSVKEIADNYHISEKTASMRLARIRKQLKCFLEQEGFA